MIITKKMLDSAKRAAVTTVGKYVAGKFLTSPLREFIPIGRANLLVDHKRARNFIKNAQGVLVPDPRSYASVDEPESVWNLVTFPGRDFLHSQCYNTSGISTNGLNFIGLSIDATLTETTASTTLSTEIVTAGLTRAAGTYAHTANANTTIVGKNGTQGTVFTASGAIVPAKGALFTAISAGTMNHVLIFTARSMVSTDTLAVTFTITLG
jgi:hypothetical protein